MAAPVPTWLPISYLFLLCVRWTNHISKLSPMVLSSFSPVLFQLQIRYKGVKLSQFKTIYLRRHGVGTPSSDQASADLTLHQ